MMLKLQFSPDSENLNQVDRNKTWWTGAKEDNTSFCVAIFHKSYKIPEDSLIRRCIFASVMLKNIINSLNIKASKAKNINQMITK